MAIQMPSALFIMTCPSPYASGSLITQVAAPMMNMLYLVAPAPLKDKIYLLTDYKGRFGSKHGDSPYRSGMDPELLRQSFLDAGYEALFVPLSKADPGDGTWKGRRVLYTSSGDKGLIYKDFIEDIVLSLEYAGASVIPRYRYLRANNNKVFMELLRELLPDEAGGNLKSVCFGSLEEVESSSVSKYPVIVQGSYGAMGRNVFLANSYSELKNIVRKRIKKIFYFF